MRVKFSTHELSNTLWVVFCTPTNSGNGWDYVYRTKRGWYQLIRKRAMEDKYNPSNPIGEKYQPYYILPTEALN